MADEIKKIGTTSGSGEKAKASKPQATMKTSEIKKISKNGNITFEVELIDGKKGTVLRQYTKVLVDITNYLQDPKNLKAYYSQRSMEKVIQAYKSVNLLTPEQRKILEKKEIDRQAGSSIAQTNAPSPGDPKESLHKVEPSTEVEELARISAAIANVGKNSTARVTAPAAKTEATPKSTENTRVNFSKDPNAQETVKNIFVSNTQSRVDLIKALTPNFRYILGKDSFSEKDAETAYLKATAPTVTRANDKLREAFQKAILNQAKQTSSDALKSFFLSPDGEQILEKPDEILLKFTGYLHSQIRHHVEGDGIIKKDKAKHVDSCITLYIKMADALAQEIAKSKA